MISVALFSLLTKAGSVMDSWLSRVVCRFGVCHCEFAHDLEAKFLKICIHSSYSERKSGNRQIDILQHLLYHATDRQIDRQADRQKRPKERSEFWIPSANVRVLVFHVVCSCRSSLFLIIAAV
jgi:hypothetical protein